MSEFFGTDGIRGVAGQYPLDRPTIELIGYALAVELTRRLDRVPHIIIGRDTRESGEWIEAAIARGAAAAHAGARSAGVITTPGVAYLTRALDADAGVVISASHNSYEDNGIKIFSGSGRKLDDEAERGIERGLTGELGVGSGKLGVASGDSGMGKVTSLSPIPDCPLPTPNSDASLGDKYLAFLRDEV